MTFWPLFADLLPSVPMTAAPDRTTIGISKNGPYVVSGPCHLRDSRDVDVPVRSRFALCRCGNSSNKPFCDRTHAKIGFDGSRIETGTPAPPHAYRGQRITIHDDRAICAHSGVCTDNLAAVFRLGKEPWIDADAAGAGRIIAVIQHCPSGALSYTLDDRAPATALRERAIIASENGPYFVSGDVELRTDGAQPRFADRYALCRCGGSKNKPFCDGTHWAIEFDETRGRQRGSLVLPLGIKRFSYVFGGILVAGAAAAILAIQAAGIGDKRVLGPGGLIADLNLALEILLVAGLTFGYWLAKRGNIAAHRYNATVWVLLNTVLVALIMAGGMENVALESVDDLAKTHVWVPWLHAVLGGATAASGLWLVLQMNGYLPRPLHVRGWKKLMQVTFAGYWIVALLGLAIYYLWYMR